MAPLPTNYYCFSSEITDAGIIHLKRGRSDLLTLCGKRAMPSLGGDRRRVTCETCRERKSIPLSGFRSMVEGLAGIARTRKD